MLYNNLILKYISLNLNYIFKIFFKEPKSKRNQKLKEIYEYKLKLLEIKQNEANMVSLIEDEIFYPDRDQDSLKRCPEAE